MLHRFCDLGNTVICIEHNLDVIKTADHVIDLGPEGGKGGGWVVAEGTPEEVAAVPESFTGQVLREVLPPGTIPARATGRRPPAPGAAEAAAREDAPARPRRKAPARGSRPKATAKLATRKRAAAGS